MSDSPAKTMKELDLWEQPREKALRYGYATLSKAELLALILRTGLPGTPITTICSRLIEANEGSLHLLMRRSAEEIQTIDGMGPVKAGQVLAILELIKRYMEEENDPQSIIIRAAEDIYKCMRFEIGNRNKEEVWIISLNRRNRIIARHRLTIGSSTASVFDLKAALKLAIIDEAESIIMCHNHPSGNLTPSPQDDAITRSLKNASLAIDLKMLDHVIISAEGYYSYADHGKL